MLARSTLIAALIIPTPPNDRDIEMAISLSELIKQNTLGRSEGFPAGVPHSYSWYKGWNPGGQLTPPPGFSAVEGWGQVYTEEGAAASANADVEVANAKTYVHIKETGQWVLVQDQSKLGLGGGHFVADFAGNSAYPMQVTRSERETGGHGRCRLVAQRDGSVSFRPQQQSGRWWQQLG